MVSTKLPPKKTGQGLHDDTTFQILKRQKLAILPARTGPHYPKLDRISAPHIESFDSLFSFSVSDAAAARPKGVYAPTPLIGGGLMEIAVSDLSRKVIFDGKVGTPVEKRNKLEIWVSQVTVDRPIIDQPRGADMSTLYPSECRERGISYKGHMQCKLNYRINDGPAQFEIRTLGKLPVMVRSTRCNLNNKSPRDLVKFHEDPEEFGGYFISNGLERLIRLLIVPRRNHPTAIVRKSFQNRGGTYTEFGIAMRCVRPDQTSQTVTMHYCSDGAVTLRFAYRKSEYMVPVVLIMRALCGISDRALFDLLTMGSKEDNILNDRVEMLLKASRQVGVYTREQCLSYLGSKFAVMLDSPDDSFEEEAGAELLRKVILVHLNTNREKFDMLVFMLQKLYALVDGRCAADNPDSPQHQEVLLPGHLYLAIIKEKLGDYLTAIKLQIQQDLRRNPAAVDFHSRKYLLRMLQKSNSAGDIGRKLEYFLSTGNLVSNTGLDLQQTSGYTIVAEKLNFYRYISHFRSIHRGSFFAELKTTTVRKLLPESWGFLCPVHTPDGSPCGLLNHLSHTCQVIVKKVDVKELPTLLAKMGVGQMNALGARKSTKHQSRKARDSDAMYVDGDSADSDEDEYVSGVLDPAAEKAARDEEIIYVQLDGKILGWCSARMGADIAKRLRHLKVTKVINVHTRDPLVPLDLEIGWVPPSSGGQYPGLFLFSTPARMMRPVKYLATGTEDMVGPFEQVYMDIACLKEDVVPGMTTHIEVAPTNVLSVVANLTPFSDHNQSPRNMYQCQMGKQSMGTPVHNFPHRTDNKLYRLQTGQSPVVRPKLHDDYGLDMYPNGMNAVVAVISYTGYDMEDASILNKSAYERGYGYGTIYKGEFIDLGTKRRIGEPISHHFGYLTIQGSGYKMPEDLRSNVVEFLDLDGLPRIGTKLTKGDPFYAYTDDSSGKVTVVAYKGMEDAWVDQVRVIGNDSGTTELQKVHIKLRIPRPPIIGDKFSSRHGQKGVISQKWPAIDMPFTETGIIPDVIINPHAFPSRMTIGMFVESLAGKSGALHGRAQDATPWSFLEDGGAPAAADFFGEELKAAGYNYHGNEPMYSGITGQEFKADIYIGVVYYQRLRHMVSDKYQVRTLGPVHNVTQQPVKGRKRAGGIRFGEMERDSLLAHGVSFLLQDRLMNCSDYSQSWVCAQCGSLVGISIMPDPNAYKPIDPDFWAIGNIPRGKATCKMCGNGDHLEVIAVPYVFKYLVSELIGMGIRLKLSVA